LETIKPDAGGEAEPMSKPALAAVSTFTPQQMKEVVGHFPPGVVVVTGVDAAGAMGLTCQSFVSLSLVPPLVAVCPSRGSVTWPRLRTLESFCINILADDQEALSGRFARSSSDKFTSVGWRAAPSGAPVLDGACAWIDCRPWSEYDGGDHTIAVAEVTALGTGPARRPLLFHRSGYGISRGAPRKPFSLDASPTEWDW
jgi:3-hydroxy-9,10-secoandrosta-1,3,5(10)-triene-9,17-dione monooxygenase reductase component